MRKLTRLVLITLFLSSCSEINTTNPIESYKHWAGEKPPGDLEVIQAKYWQSAHWTKEYIFYAKVKPTEEWWNGFVSQNNLKIDEGQWTAPEDAPDWFTLPADVIRYRLEDYFYDSRFLRDTKTGECFIYDIQL